MDKWAKPITDEINGVDSTQSSPSKSLTQSVALPRQEQSQGRLEPKLTSSTASRPAANFVDEAKGDEEPIETVSPKSVKNKGPKLPGYVSKFTANIHPDDKLELDKISEEFERQAWLIDSSSSASLFYTSKTLKQIEDERNANAPQEEEEKEQEDKPPAVVLFEEHTALTIGVIVMTLILFSHVLPTFVSFILFAVATGALDYKLFLEFTKEKDEKKPDAPVKAAPKPYKVKLMTNVVGLPDDVANALFVEENRKKWDIYATILKESDSKYIFYRKSPSSCQILETRNPGKRNERKTLIEINKIKGKPYFLRLTAYSSITTEILEKVGKEAAHNYFD